MKWTFFSLIALSIFISQSPVSGSSSAAFFNEPTNASNWHLYWTACISWETWSISAGIADLNIITTDKNNDVVTTTIATGIDTSLGTFTIPAVYGGIPGPVSIELILTDGSESILSEFFTLLYSATEGYGSEDCFIPVIPLPQ